VTCSFNNTAKAACQPYEEQMIYRDCEEVNPYCFNEGLCSSIHRNEEKEKWYFNEDCFNNETVTSPPCGEWQIRCMMLPPPTPGTEFTVKDVCFIIIMGTLCMSMILNGYHTWLVLHLQEQLEQYRPVVPDGNDDDDGNDGGGGDDDDDGAHHPEADPEGHDQHNEPHHVDGDPNAMEQDDGADGGGPDERNGLGAPLLQRPPTPRHGQTPAEAALHVSFNLLSQRASAIRVGQQIFEEDHRRVMEGPGSYRKMPLSSVPTTISPENWSADVHEKESEASSLSVKSDADDDDDDDGFFVEELDEEQEIKENPESAMPQDNNDEKMEDFFLFNRRYQPLPLPTMFSSPHSPWPEQNDPEKQLQG